MNLDPYSKLLTAADARTNTSSANYKAGYNAGNSAGVASVTVSASASGRTVTATASNGKSASASVALAGSNGTVSVSTSGGSGNQSFDITDGWCTKINVDRTGAYNAGVTAGVSSVTLNTPSVSGRAVTVTASNGKSATGYVEDKGQYYSSSNNVGEAGTYFHATFPEGYYSSSGQPWAPEIRVEKTTMNSSGWYDRSQYDQHYTDGYNAGYSAGHSSISSVKVTLYVAGEGGGLPRKAKTFTFSYGQTGNFDDPEGNGYFLRINSWSS